MYKVFVDDTPIILSTRKNIGNLYFSVPIKMTNIKQIIKKIKKGKLKYVNLYHPNREKLLKHFGKQIKPINAGGGIVKNADNEVLFIFRKGKWDIPKGRVEKEESIEDAAIREVKEETGVENLKITNPTPHITYHIMKRKGKYRLKVTHWFEMETDYSGPLTPEANEDITKAVWKSPSEINKALQNSYANIKLLF